MLKYMLFVCLAMMMIAPSKSFGMTYDLTSTYLSRLSNNCQHALQSRYYSTTNVTLVNGDTYKVYTIDTNQNPNSLECYNAEKAIAAEIASGYLRGSEYFVVMVYDVYNNRILFPDSSDYTNYLSGALQQANLIRTLVTSVVGTSDTSITPSIGGTAILKIDGTGNCQDSNASGAYVSGWFVFGQACGSSVSDCTCSGGYCIGGAGRNANAAACLYRTCFSGGVLQGYTFDSSVCGPASCNSGYYLEGKNCVQCPGMVDKWNNMIYGYSPPDDNASISKCTMSPQVVFANQTGEWSFSTACPASN